MNVTPVVQDLQSGRLIVPDKVKELAPATR